MYGVKKKGYTPFFMYMTMLRKVHETLPYIAKTYNTMFGEIASYQCKPMSKARCYDICYVTFIYNKCSVTYSDPQNPGNVFFSNIIL